MTQSHVDAHMRQYSLGKIYSSLEYLLEAFRSTTNHFVVLLNCANCSRNLMFFSSEVYQCQGGHLICQCCKEKSDFIHRIFCNTCNKTSDMSVNRIATRLRDTLSQYHHCDEDEPDSTNN